MTLGRVHRLFALVVLVYLLVPLALALPLALGEDETMRFPPRGLTLAWFVEFLSDPRWTGPSAVSVALAAGAATVATIAAGLAGWVLVKRPFRGRAPLAALLGAPLVVPAISVAVGCYIVWAGLRMIGSPIALLATHAVLAAPVVLVVIGAAAVRFDDTQIGAARSLGAGGWQVARRIVLPQLLPSVVAAWLLSFVLSFDEVVITRFLLAAGQVPTLSVFIFNQLHWTHSPAIAASSVVLTAVGLLTALAIVRLDPRRAG